MSGFIGTYQFVEMEPGEQWNSIEGWSKIRRWNGPQAQYQSFMQGGIPGGYVSVRTTQTGDVVLVEASYPSVGAGDTGGQQPDPIARGWTLNYQRQELPLYQSPQLRLVLRLSRIDVAQFRRAVDVCRGTFTPVMDPEGGSSEFPLSVDDAGNQTNTLIRWGLLDDTTKQILREYYARFLCDAGTFPVTMPVLTRNDILATTSQVRATQSNVGHSFTKSQLFSTEPTLPSALLVDPESQDFAAYVWIKQAPDLKATSQGRMELIQEFLGLRPANWDDDGLYGFGLYDDLIYPAAIV